MLTCFNFVLFFFCGYVMSKLWCDRVDQKCVHSTQNGCEKLWMKKCLTSNRQLRWPDPSCWRWWIDGTMLEVQWCATNFYSLLTINPMMTVNWLLNIFAPISQSNSVNMSTTPLKQQKDIQHRYIFYIFILCVNLFFFALKKAVNSYRTQLKDIDYKQQKKGE